MHQNVGDVLIDILGEPDEVLSQAELFGEYMEEYLESGELLRANADGTVSVWWDRGNEVADPIQAISDQCPPERYEAGEPFELNPGDSMRVNADGSVDIWRYKEPENPTLPIDDPPQDEKLEGNANSDGAVDLEDFNILKANFGESGDYSQGDFNGDGEINLDDFVMFSANFGRVAKSKFKHEDRDGDGKNDHTFHDSDWDGKWDWAHVDPDEDGKDDELWRDSDDDGDWDSVTLDKNDDGVPDEAKWDTDGDGKFDYRWRDFDGDGQMDEGEHAPMFFPVPINGPRTP